MLQRGSIPEITNLNRVLYTQSLLAITGITNSFTRNPTTILKITTQSLLEITNNFTRDPTYYTEDYYSKFTRDYWRLLTILLETQPTILKINLQHRKFTNSVYYKLLTNPDKYTRDY